MSSWWSFTREYGDTAYLTIEFESQNTNPVNIRGLVGLDDLPTLRQLTPEEIKEGSSLKGIADVYVSNPMEGGSQYFGSFEQVTVMDNRLEIMMLSHYPVAELPDGKPDKQTTLILSLLGTQGLKVRNWEVMAGYHDDPPKQVAQGDHQALIAYLELDKPE